MRRVPVCIAFLKKGVPCTFGSLFGAQDRRMSCEKTGLLRGSVVATEETTTEAQAIMLQFGLDLSRNRVGVLIADEVVTAWR